MEQYCSNNFNGAGVCPYYQAPYYMRSEPMEPYMEDALPTASIFGINLPDSWSFGPLKIEWSFSGESINVVLKVFEDAVKNLVLTLSKPTISVTTTIGNTTINMKLNADFVNKQIYINGAFCVETVCTTFNNTVIAKW